MNNANDEINKFKQKIKEKEQSVFVTLTDQECSGEILSLKFIIMNLTMLSFIIC